MSDRQRPTHDGIAVLSWVIVVAALSLGLGTLTAGLSDPAIPPGDVDRVNPPQDVQGGAATRSPVTHPWSDGLRGSAEGTSPLIGRLPAPAKDASPSDLTAHVPSDEDARTFLTCMTAVMHRQGLPLPAGSGRLSSMVTVSTPRPTTELGTLAASTRCDGA